MATNANECKQQTDLDHAKEQFNMYIGANIVAETTEYVLAETATTSGPSLSLSQKSVRTNYAALKVLDEILVNALDQKLKCEQIDKQSEFNVYIEQKGDVISYTNINSYINIVEKIQTIDKRMIPLPQFLFGEFKTSTNFTKKVRDTGGAFGYGAKLTNAFSNFFRVEIHHPGVGLYLQEWRDRMTKVSEPIFTPEDKKSPSSMSAYVRITVILDWKTFGITTAEEKETLFNLAKIRALQGAASIGPKHKVYWNNNLIPINSPKTLQMLYAPNLLTAQEFILKNESGTWNVIIGIKDDGENFKHFLLTNGNYSKNGGSQVDHIQGQIIDYVKPIIMEMMTKTHKNEKKRITNNQISRYLYIQIISRVLGAQYSGQKKEEITLEAMDMKNMAIDKSILESIWRGMEDLINRDMFMETAIPKSRKIKNAKKYQPCEKTGSRASLFIVEGDSAYGVVATGIKTGYCGLSNVNYGIYSIQGVPLNPRPLTTKTSTGGFKVGQKVTQNNRLMTLFGILGLNIGEKANLNKLTYGHVIIVTDEDADGRGNIRSSLMSTFQLYWPELITAGFLQFMRTPLIRAIPTSSSLYVEEFYSEKECEDWKKRVDGSQSKCAMSASTSSITSTPAPSGSSLISSQYTYKYLKGLASHKPAEVRQMFKNFDKMLITYTSDKYSEATCEIYFGKAPGPRKTMLETQIAGTEDDFFIDNKLSITYHCHTETKNYMFDNLHRHIPEIDGMTNAQRIIIAGIFKSATASNGKEIKVDSLAAWIKTKLEYHHGLASLEESLIGLAQSFVGAQEIPFARALGSFGDRDIPVAGSPRYVATTGNMHILTLMFPRIDSYMLKHEFREGTRCEPEHYMPIIPPMFNSHRSPAKGAACKIIARDAQDIFTRTKASIKAGKPLSSTDQEFKMCERGLRHKLVFNKNGNPISLGTYIFEPQKKLLTITELPMFATCMNFIDGSGAVKKANATKKPKGRKTAAATAAAAKKAEESKTRRNKKTGIRNLEWVNQIMNNTRDDGISIAIKLNDNQPFGNVARVGPVDNWEDDPIVKALQLSETLNSNLKFLINGALKYYASYVELFNAWWPLRKALYDERIERSILLLKIENTLLENQLRYIAESNKMKMNISTAQQINLLIERKYQPIVTKILKASYVPTKELLMVAFPPVNIAEPSAYDYIVHLRQNDLSDENAKKLTDELKKNLARIAELSQPGYAMQTWLNEVEKLEKVVQMGQASDWTCWDKPVKYRD